MNSDLAQKAIVLAMAGDWKEVIKVNKELLAINPDDTETLNRLARAYFEYGDIKKARSTLSKVLKSNPTDAIATKNLAKWKGISSTKRSVGVRSQAIDFIEEPGKTKIVTLLNLGDKRVIGGHNAGDEVKITTHTHRVCVISLDGKYVGCLPDDLAARLIRLTRAGNTYQVYIKSIDQAAVKVFIRETSKNKKMANVQSFPPDVVRSLESSNEVFSNF